MKSRSGFYRRCPLGQKSAIQSLHEREIQSRNNRRLFLDQQITPELVRRLGLVGELKGHTGCVNCIEWNRAGSLLASSSDDLFIILWDAMQQKSLTRVLSGHSGNVFSVKFMPHTSDQLVATGAADSLVNVTDISQRRQVHSFSDHSGRVKRLGVADDEPYVLWSAAEDGCVLQTDLRDSPVSPRVLINMNAHLGLRAEVKSLAINPVNSQLIAIGVNDPFARVFDRRFLSLKRLDPSASSSSTASIDDHEGVPSLRRRGRSLAILASDADFPLPRFDEQGCRYFVPGHLQRRTHCNSDPASGFCPKSFACTSIQFSPCGSELLFNLGGEQIYLFDIRRSAPLSRIDFRKLLNGLKSSPVNGHVCAIPSASQSCQDKATDNEVKRWHYSSGDQWEAMIDKKVQLLREEGNEHFKKQSYARAVESYNMALSLKPNQYVFGNRAAAYLKRGWAGDYYAALCDCISALKLDYNHFKVVFRLIQSLHELSRNVEAMECLELFRANYPAQQNSKTLAKLELDIKKRLKNEDKASSNGGGDNDDDDDTTAATAEKEIAETPNTDSETLSTLFEAGPDEAMARRSRYRTTSRHEQKRMEMASDFVKRFCGHCNTSTDIKEASFFGERGQYVMAGSDDGTFLIWQKNSSNLVRVLNGDNSIVNCLQAHPTSFLLATSGIDPVVRVWSALGDDSVNDRVVLDNIASASANQERMQANPFELMLASMGYRIAASAESDPDEPTSSAVQCAPS